MRCRECPLSVSRVCHIEDVPGLCQRPEFREMIARESDRWEREEATGVQDREVWLRPLLPLISACPHRGGPARLPATGVRVCGELTECKAQRDSIPGRMSRSMIACTASSPPKTFWVAASARSCGAGAGTHNSHSKSSESQRGAWECGRGQTRPFRVGGLADPCGNLGHPLRVGLRVDLRDVGP
jgi:hypothetical protein